MSAQKLSLPKKLQKIAILPEPWDAESSKATILLAWESLRAHLQGYQQLFCPFSLGEIASRVIVFIGNGLPCLFKHPPIAGAGTAPRLLLCFQLGVHIAGNFKNPADKLQIRKSSVTDGQDYTALQWREAPTFRLVCQDLFK